MSHPPSLPSVLPSTPALQDGEYPHPVAPSCTHPHSVTTTPEQLQSALARVTNPTETPIFVCALNSCYRLFPSKERLMFHRKRDHDTDEQDDIITWNE
ncbi:hypothetical protein B0H21DRAFT_821180 [Amylocystis lapponica]|nr:hypothetical protein B0H21DRAFT_821180 [Amylocystis lapponica]